MTHTVTCSKYKTDMEGLSKPPFPGPKGQQIYQQVSAKAWQEWQAHQTRLINEKQLVMTDPAARKYLLEQMDKFLNGEDFDQAEGYVPES